MEDALSKLGVDRRALANALERTLGRDPLFSPITELSLSKERTLGEGGMGVVLLVSDRRLGRRAALKLLKEGASETRARRFLREAAITARLDHPGIPPIFEVGRTTDGTLFLLMRFVDGKSLAEVLADEPSRPPLRDILAILVRVAEATAYAHSKMIVHRDLKPANVMVGSFGEVLVMDWGLARNLGESPSEDAALREDSKAVATSDAKGSSRLTQADTVLGTLGYMAPEQARSEEVGPRADVFSLGAILTEVLSGTIPIEGDTTLALLRATIEGRIVLPRALNPSVPRELDAIAARALAPRARDRYPTATAFADDLRAWLEGRDVSVHRYGPLAQARRLVGRHPAFVAASAVALLATTLATVAVALKNIEIGRTNDDLQRTVVALEKAQKEREAAERERSVAEKARAKVEQARALLAEASTRFRQGARSEDVRRLVRDAVSMDRSEPTLLEGGRVLAGAGETDAARELFRACADEWKPGYAALYALHEIEWGTRMNIDVFLTPPLKELVLRARARKEENEFTAIAGCLSAIEVKDYEKAIALGERAALKAPRLASAHALLAEARYRKGDLEGATRESELAIEADPGSVLAINARACMRMWKGDLDGAFQDLTRLLSLAPGCSFVWANRSKVRLEKGDFDGALADGTKAIECEPQHVAGWEARAHARLKKNDVDGALEDATRIIQLDPKRARAWSNRAEVRFTKGDLEGALADATRAVEIEPNEESLGARARMRSGMGDAAGAVADAARATELEPRSAYAWSFLGGARADAGDLDGAVAACSKAIALDPRHWQGWNNRSLAEFRREELDAAARDVEKALEITQRESGPFLTRGIVRGHKGDHKGALSDLTRSLELQPDFWEARINRAIERDLTGDQDGALADTTRVIELVPSLAGAWKLRGHIRAKKDDPVGAIADLERFVTLSKNEGERAEARKEIEELRARK